MKSRVINFVVIIFIMLVLFFQISGIAQRRNSKPRPQPVKVIKPAEEWAAEPDSTFYKFITALPEIEKVDLYYYRSRKRNPFYYDEPPLGTVKQFGMPVDVISSKTLNNTDAKSFAFMWRRMLRGSGAGCLAPAYRVRFYANNKLVLESDLCFHCHNRVVAMGQIAATCYTA